MPEDVEAAKADVEQTRAELQQTVDQLTDRLDPRVRAREAGQSLQQTAAGGLDTAKQNPVPVVAVAAAVVAALVGIVIWKRRSG